MLEVKEAEVPESITSRPSAKSRVIDWPVRDVKSLENRISVPSIACH